MGILISFLLSCVSVWVATYLLSGVSADNWQAIVLVTLVMAVINAVLKPILVILSLPLTIITLGLFLIVINIALVLLAASLVPGFHIDGWLSALLFGIIVSIVGSALHALKP